MELQKRDDKKDEKQIGKPNGKRKKGKRYLLTIDIKKTFTS